MQGASAGATRVPAGGRAGLGAVRALQRDPAGSALRGQRERSRRTRFPPEGGWCRRPRPRQRRPQPVSVGDGELRGASAQRQECDAEAEKRREPKRRVSITLLLDEAPLRPSMSTTVLRVRPHWERLSEVDGLEDLTGLKAGILPKLGGLDCPAVHIQARPCEAVGQSTESISPPACRHASMPPLRWRALSSPPAAPSRAPSPSALRTRSRRGVGGGCSWPARGVGRRADVLVGVAVGGVHRVPE